MLAAVIGPLRKRVALVAAAATPWIALHAVLQPAFELLRTLPTVVILVLAFLVPAVVEIVLVCTYPRGVFRLKAVQHSYVRGSEGHLVGVV